MEIKIKGLKHNFLMYFIRLFSGFGFTIMVFPYIARKIGAEGIGKVQYIETIVNYFILFINLGIFGYGKREVAQYRDDEEKLNNIVNELLTILYITTFLGSIIYFVFIFFFSINTIDRNLFIIYFTNILLNVLNVEWFYVGIENQEYMTKRNMLVKLISGILIFIFIKKKEDIYIYVLILILATAGSNVYNFINLKKYIKLKLKTYQNYKKHLKPIFYLFSASLAISISYNLDSIMIKNMVGDAELGYYALALKFGKLPMVIGTTLIAVLSPRLNSLLSKNKIEDYFIIWNKGINIMFILYIPCMIGMILLATPLTLILGGKEFLPATIMFQVFAVYIFITGFSVSTGVALGTHRKDKEYFLSVAAGAILNFIFNIVFIPKIGAVGAAIATIITEVIAIIIRIVLCKDIFRNIKLINKNMLKMFLSSLIMGALVFIIIKQIKIPVLQIIISGALGGLIYFLILLILKEKLTLEMFNKIKNKIV